ncbi:hypothetical protein OS190_06040 [Sulfitobacter sp. F26204]|uniref:hypothetical protein n=1 Tax=Sulfitobacter sp. F26204 TaxID=2996014 RepID=UPI00225DFE3A|nr:hypothetical protein [Sulfitobacter sp. F26204]MCX7559122.1 hypothetical protein [Sulfitobacter sp. F26204]
MFVTRNLIVITLCTGLAACGSTIAEQSLGGAAIGAGAAALTSGSLAQGAAVGAAGNITYCKFNPGRCN